MKKFKYRLQPLLDLRKHYEREWEIKLAEVTGRCVLLRKEIEELEAEIAGLGLLHGFDMGTAIATDLYRQRLKARVEELSEQLQKTEAERKEVETSYFAASRDRKIIDKLRDRKAEEFRQDRLKADAKTTDEIAGSASARDLLRD